MDDLDRLYIELVEVLRRDRADKLEEPLTIAELYRERVPYQRVREPAGLRSHDDYEVALSRLLSGERDYVITDAADMQAEVRAGLEETYPDVRRFHAFSDVLVKLNPEHIPPPGHIRYAPPELQEAAMREVEAERITRRQAAEEAERLAREEAERMAREEQEREQLEMLEPQGAAAGEVNEGACPACNEALPLRPLKFCPHCGDRLRHLCSACGARVEAEWKYCGVCGAEQNGDSVGPA